MELTQQLGKTVLFGDIALSPDGARVAWVQSTAATAKPKPLYLSTVSGNGAATRLSLPGENGERVDSDPAWAPDSKTIAFFSTAGEKDDQRQLWTANADGSNPQKLTALQGYAARPHWSANGKQIAFLYIEGAGGGGPLVAAPSTTGVVDTAIHNQRIALLDLATKKVRQVSPADLHIYDFDWSPDGKTFVASAAPGPGNNNWWIAQIYTIDLGKGSATSIYKPSLQVAVPRWSPDGKSVAFIEGIMSDEGFHGGDLFTISATGPAPNESDSETKKLGQLVLLANAGAHSPHRVCRRRQRHFGTQPGRQFHSHSLAGAGRFLRLRQFSRFRARPRRQSRRARPERLRHAAGSLGRTDRAMASAHPRQRRSKTDLGQSGEPRVDERRRKDSRLVASAGES